MVFLLARLGLPRLKIGSWGGFVIHPLSLKNLKKILLGILLFFSARAKADYFYIHDISPQPSSGHFLAPWQVIQDEIGIPAEEILKIIDLMSWDRIAGSYPAPIQKYNRPHHFGRWVNDPNDPDCHNTRAKVLIRDSKVEVTLSDKNHCNVSLGEWVDPYSGGTYTVAKDVQIDHVVPLKHAYISGADQWDFKKRCLYANFMSNEFHLLSVGGKYNMQKSDKSPDQWMPPKADYKCEYLENWLKIKLIWGLAIHEAEAQAIRNMIAANSCDLGRLAFTDKMLSNQRNEIMANIELCANITQPPLPPTKEEGP